MNPTLEAGRCSYCNSPTNHGPWSQSEFDEACADIGIPPNDPDEDFVDLCDKCFISEVCGGDIEHAEQLLKRKLPRRITPDNPLYPILLALKDHMGPMPK